MSETLPPQTCTHCQEPIPAQTDAQDNRFCCKGCEGAYHLIKDMGLKSYYERRMVDPEVKPLRPDEDSAQIDYKAHIHCDDDTETLYLMVEGIHCAACVWLIETALSRQDGVLEARVNMTTRRLVLRWEAGACDPNQLVATITGLGYRLVPYDPGIINSESERQEKELLRAMAVAGFAMGNVMLFSVSVWAGYTQGMMASTRDLMHWLSALIALPAVAYAGRPFYHSAWAALKAGRVNMDVPITMAVVMAAAMSLYQVAIGAEHAYFDSSVGLLFFLLIGRYLDRRARGKARSAAEQLLGLNATAVTVLDETGRYHLLPPNQVSRDMRVLCSVGERIAVDGTVEEGASDVDMALITGESVPSQTRCGDKVFAGTINLTAPLVIRVNATGESTLLAEIVRLMEEAEKGRAKYVAAADRVAKSYAPTVHILALVAYVFWFFVLGATWNESLLVAISVLIITCPCALALAVPVVQVIASGRLMRQGILVKNATALERFGDVRHVVFDKTGTLTLGRAELVNQQDIDPQILHIAASMAANSKHPLSKALKRACPDAGRMKGVQEVPGAGLAGEGVRLGSRTWCGDDTAAPPEGPELWFAQDGMAPVVFRFEDPLRADAGDVISKLKQKGLSVHLLSGDRLEVVEKVARKLEIEDFHGGCSPSQKTEVLKTLDHVLMIGDGLNDAPALAAAHVSLSPSSAIDVSQNTADAVFQGDKLRPVLEILQVAEKSETLVKQNFFLSFLYNIITVPLAMAGFVTPLIAAVAMSASSLVVIANALRLNKGKRV